MTTANSDGATVCSVATADSGCCTTFSILRCTRFDSSTTDFNGATAYVIATTNACSVSAACSRNITIVDLYGSGIYIVSISVT